MKEPGLPGIERRTEFGHPFLPAPVSHNCYLFDLLVEFLAEMKVVPPGAGRFRLECTHVHEYPHRALLFNQLLELRYQLIIVGRLDGADGLETDDIAAAFLQDLQHLVPPFICDLSLIHISEPTR